MRKTIKFLWIYGILAGVLAFSIFWRSGILSADDSDLDLKIRSLSNRVRAYALRAKSMEELVSEYPEEAFPLLVKLLRDSGEAPPLRSLAAQNLSRIDRTRALKIFDDLFEDHQQDSFARRAAFAEWAQLGPVNLRQRLRDCLEDWGEDAAIRQYCLALFSRSEEKGKLEKIRMLVRSKQETLSMRTNALFELERLGDLDFVLAAVRQFLDDRGAPEALRENCVLLIGRHKDPSSIALLARIAQDHQESERLRKIAEAILSNPN